MEIRDAIGIRTGEKILLNVSAAQGGRINASIARAPENVESCAFSRNGSYVEKKQGGVKNEWNGKQGEKRKGFTSRMK